MTCWSATVYSHVTEMMQQEAVNIFDMVMKVEQDKKGKDEFATR